ncbi:MAG: 3-dehydroquinate synthase family protein [Planctomycetota bacterium]
MTAASDSVRTMPIELGDRSYEVRIGPGVLGEIGTVVRDRAGARRVMVVVDAGVPTALVNEMRASLADAGCEVCAHAIEPSEPGKSLETVQSVLVAVAEAKLDRGDAIVALGGGIVGDVAGFVAASYRRGITVVQCPTTLLAMVDASVGGKTGVNLATGGGLKKNVVGAFWQPAAVLADTRALASLPARVHRAGVAECMKHGMIWRSVGAAQDGLFEATVDAFADGASPSSDAIAALIHRNVMVKAGAVAGDERETAPSSVGGRALLNLGHTFGHALEWRRDLSPTGDPALAPLHHGEAVAVGLVAATGAAIEGGLIDAGALEAVRRALREVGLPVALEHLPPDEVVIETMSHDKKVAGGRLRLVLPASEDGSLGSAVVVEAPDAGVVHAGLAAIRAR